MDLSLARGRLASRLAALRSDLGLTQQQAALGLGCSRGHLATIERGTHLPSEALVAKLCGLYGAPEVEALWSAALAEQGTALALRRSRSAAVLMDDSRGLAHQLHEWERSVRRRRFLALAGGAGSALIGTLRSPDQYSRLARIMEGSARLDLRAVADLRSVTAEYERLYHGSIATELIGPLTRHLLAMHKLLKGAPSGPARVELVVAISEAALVVGWMNLYDFGHTSFARQSFRLSAQAGDECGQAAMQVCALGELSSLSMYELDFREALAWAQRGIGHTAHVSPRVRAWLAVTEAEARARLRDPNNTLRALAEADRFLDAATPGEDDAWITYFDRARLEARRGTCYLWLGWPDASCDVLTRAVDQLAPSASKRRGFLLADLANAHLRGTDSNITDACRIATEATDTLRAHRHAVGSQRLLFVRSQLRRSPSTPETRALQIRIDDLVSTSAPS